MYASITSTLAPIILEDPHEEARNILRRLHYDDADLLTFKSEIADDLYHLLQTIREHDVEEERIIERIFCPRFREHLENHNMIEDAIHTTIHMLHQATIAPHPDWHEFQAQMEITKCLIEKHIVEFDDPLLRSAAQGSS